MAKIILESQIAAFLSQVFFFFFVIIVSVMLLFATFRFCLYFNIVKVDFCALSL